MYQIHNKKGNIQNLETMSVFAPEETSRAGRKYLSWIDKGNEPLPVDIIDPWIAKRQERNLILQSCDWTIGNDTPLSVIDRGFWEVYRQELRDLPIIYPDANDIIWPVPPGL